MTYTIRLSRLYMIEKEKLAISLFYLGMLLAFLASMNPWFLWPLGSLYHVPAAMLVIASLMVSNTMEKSPFSREDYLLPLLAYVVYAVYERLSMESNVNGFIMIFFKATVVYGLFRMEPHRLFSLTTFISKVMGALLAASLLGFFLYLLGFSLPGRPAQLGDFYSFTNYYLFLLDDRNLFAIFPRFNSYFPEPSHVGSAAAFLLFAQRGHWRKWYNIVLITTVCFSFSLAAYIYFTAIVFLNLWAEKKHVLRKLAVTVGVVAAAVIATFTYNGGDNLVHDLILLRLEVDDGELAGDNRITGNFEQDYANYLQSGDIVFGRSYDNTLEFGNAGYKVFFYDHGLVGILLILAFYILALGKAANKRAAFSALVIASLYFLPSAYMLSEKLLFSIYAGAYRDGAESETLRSALPLRSSKNLEPET